MHKIRRQDPALGREQKERARIKQYRKAVEVAAAGKLAESFERLDKMGAIVACGLGEQADKLADEYVRLAEAKFFRRGGFANLGGSASRQLAACAMRLKSKGLLGANDVDRSSPGQI